MLLMETHTTHQKIKSKPDIITTKIEIPRHAATNFMPLYTSKLEREHKHKESEIHHTRRQKMKPDLIKLKLKAFI